MPRKYTPRRPRVLITCQQCEVQISVKACKGDQKFCSRACQAASDKASRITVACQFCGKPFWVHRYRAETAQFCSYRCGRLVERVAKSCEQCGGSFEDRITSTKTFCSLQCKGLASRIPFTQRLWSKVLIGNGCWEWTAGKNRGGYGHFDDAPAHRVVWELLRGPIPDGLFVCHDCPGGDNPSCVRPSHMFLGTQTDNMADAVQKGRTAKGSGHSQAVLTEAIVLAMRIAHAQGMTVSLLAHQHHVSHSAAKNAISGKTWGHVQ